MLLELKLDQQYVFNINILYMDMKIPRFVTRKVKALKTKVL